MSTLQVNCELLCNLSLVSCRFFNQSNKQSFELPKLDIDKHPLISPGFLYLRRLDLTSSLKGDEQVVQLANSSAFKYLEFLKLKNCGVSNQGFTELLGSRHLRRLKVLILSKNQITKLVFPYEDLKTANKVQLKREVMELSILDIRNNQISSTKFSSKFLRNTMVLAWDNGVSQKAIESNLQRTKHLTSLEGPASAKTESDFNPFAVINPSEG